MKSAFTLSCLFVTGCFIGCSEQTSTITDVSITPEVLTSYKSSLGLTEEPEQAVSILDARAATAAADEAHDHEGHDEDGHDHEGHDHDAHDQDGQDHDGHDHDEHGPDHDDHAGHDHDQGHSHDAHGEHIVIVGKIGGAPGAERTSADFPFENGKASFVVHDPSFESPHGAGHEHADGHDCHFCQTKAYDAQAFVRFLGEDGKPLPVDARELFDIKENDIVVIKGHARMKTGLLMIDGEGLYVRR